MIIRKRLTEFLLTIFTLLFVSYSNVIYAESSPLIAPPKQHFKIALSEISYPYHFVNQQGEPDGVMVDYWHLWAEKLGVTVEFVPLTWLETLAKTAEGAVDFHSGLVHLEQREKKLDFSQEIYPLYSYIYLHKDLTGISNINQLTPYNVGVVDGASHQTRIQQHNEKIQIRTFESRSKMYQAGLNQEILAFGDQNKLNEEYPHLDRLTVLFPHYKRISYFSGSYSSAVAKGNTQTLAFINYGITQISDGEKQAIEDKWFSNHQDEQQLTLAFSDNLSPYMAYSSSGKPQGLFVEFWKLWAKYSGIEVKFIGASMARSVDMVKQGVADIHIGYPAKSPSEFDLPVSDRMYQLRSQVYLNKQLATVKSFAELAGYTVGVFVTAPYLDELKQQYTNVNFKLFRNHDEMINAAESDEIVAMISEVENMNYQLIQKNLQSTYVLLEQPTFSVDMHALLNLNNPGLRQLVNDGFKQIPLDELKSTEQIWLTYKALGYYQQMSQKLDLNEVQQAFITDHPKVKVGVTSDWDPIEYVDNNGQITGINIDILNIIAKRTGLKWQFSIYDNWNDLYQALLSGDVDMVAGIEENLKRQQLFNFTDAYWSMPWGIVHRQSIEPKKSIEYFYGKQLAIVKGYKLLDFIRESHPNINVIVVDNLDEGLIAVQQGLADGYVEALPVASKLVRRESLVPLSISIIDEIPLEHTKMATNIKKTVLAELLNIALKTITDSERKQIFEKWFDINVQTGLDRRLVTKIAALAGALIFVIILIIAFWNRKLRLEIAHREALEKKMKHMATHDELTGVANRMLMKEQIQQSIAIHQRQQIKLALLFIDLDGFKGVNDKFGHDVGDQVLIEVAQRLQTCVRQSDIVARFGGDEFVILLTGLHKSQEAAFVADKIVHLLGQPYELSNETAELGCSIGVAVYPDDGDNDIELLKMADNLMYRVKSRGKNGYFLR